MGLGISMEQSSAGTVGGIGCCGDGAETGTMLNIVVGMGMRSRITS